MAKQDINRALRIASEFDSGMVGVNYVSLIMMNVPFRGS
jgi:aldehyde dehydrogenase (NAD+)